MKKSFSILTNFLTIGILVFLAVSFSSGARAAAKPGMTSLGVQVGNLAPEFSFQDLNGKWVSLSDYRGKKVFIFSWATWCTCKEELPFIQDFYKKYKSKDFEIIAVASDSQGVKWVKPYLDKAKATYISLIDPNNELAVKYNFLATQNGFLVDENGIIRLSSIGFDIRKPEEKDALIKLVKTNFGAVTPAKQKSLNEKIKDLETGLGDGPKSVPNRIELAELYRQSGDLDKAEATLNDAIKLKKMNAESHYRLGVILYQKGKIDDAVKEWERAYKYDSTNYLYMRNIEAYKNPEKFYSEMMEKK